MRLNRHKWLIRLAVAALISLWAVPCWAITARQLDDFSDGTTEQWRVGFAGLFPVSEPNYGPGGDGDNCLWMATEGAGGSQPMLVVFNASSNWTGNWTGAGITRIEMDVQGPSSNSFPLEMRIGIVGPGGVFQGGTGDTYVTPSIQVPSDTQWHHISIDVSASDFIPFFGTDIESALEEVVHFRILHNPEESFIGADTHLGGGEFYLDNILAFAAPAGLAGDYSGNGSVDAADYVVWRDTQNQAVTPGSGADGDGSGMIDDADYDFWRARFGNGGAGSGNSVAGVAVPEPATWLGILVLSLFITFSRRIQIGGRLG